MKMGVTGLWKILDELELGEKKPLNFLSGKRIAVDLSGWVVQAMTSPGLKKSKNPHLKILFFRVSRLLNNGALPIFILEGKIPDLKVDVFKDRNCLGISCSDNVARSSLDKLLNECKTFLQSLGVPCIKSSGEAEALCGFLHKHKVVDGVITEDGDAFLYGADTVLRDFSADKKDPHVKQYSLKSTKNTLKLDQQKLIALALLLGCDYGKGGVPGIGQRTFIKLLSEFMGRDLIQRFSEWKEKKEFEVFPGYDSTVQKQVHCKQCNHFGSQLDHQTTGCNMCESKDSCLSDRKIPCSCTWHKTQEISLKQKTELKVYHAAKKLQDFPNLQVVEEFNNYKDAIPDKCQLEWKCPNLEEFQKKTRESFNWSYEDSQKKGFPLITLWQQIKLSQNPPINDETFLFKPIKILKKRTREGEGCFEVQWSHTDGKVCDTALDNLRILEIEERFKKVYPELSEEFYNLNKPKDKSKTKKKSAKATAENSKKVISENTVDSLYNLTPIKQSLPNVLFNSPQNESSDSFSYLPLCERIKIIAEGLPKQKEKSLKCQTTSSNVSLSPVQPTMLSNNEVTSPDFLLDNMNRKPSFYISLKEVSQLNTKIECLADEMKELNISNSDSKHVSHPIINFKTSVDELYPCLEFSDSDESYVDILQNDVKSFYDVSSDYLSGRTSVLVNNTELNSVDGSNIETYHVKNQLDFLSPSMDNYATNSRVVYSINKNSPKSIICNNCSDKSISFLCNSTPKLNLRKSVLQRILRLNATKESPVYSCSDSLQIYSPIMFDSSHDDSI